MKKNKKTSEVEKLTPETEECYSRVPASFPSDWWDRSVRGLVLKKEAPRRAHKAYAKYNKDYDEAFEKGIMID